MRSFIFFKQKNSTATHLFSCYFDTFLSFEKRVLDFLVECLLFSHYFDTFLSFEKRVLDF